MATDPLRKSAIFANAVESHTADALLHTVLQLSPASPSRHWTPSPTQVPTATELPWMEPLNDDPHEHCCADVELALLVAPYGQALHADKDATANVSAGHVSAVYSQDCAPATDRVLTGQLAEQKAKRGTQERCNANGSV